MTTESRAKDGVASTGPDPWRLRTTKATTVFCGSAVALGCEVPARNSGSCDLPGAARHLPHGTTNRALLPLSVDHDGAGGVPGRRCRPAHASTAPRVVVPGDARRDRPS